MTSIWGEFQIISGHKAVCIFFVTPHEETQKNLNWLNETGAPVRVTALRLRIHKSDGQLAEKIWPIAADSWVEPSGTVNISGPFWERDTRKKLRRTA